MIPGGRFKHRPYAAIGIAGREFLDGINRLAYPADGSG